MKTRGFFERIKAGYQAATGGELITTSAQLERALRAGSGTVAGAHVSQTNALSMSAVYACIRILADSVAMCPLVLYETGADGRHSEARTHPLWHLLTLRPNDWQTPYDFWRMLMLHLLTHGNAYVFVSRSGGRVLDLIPLDPSRMDVRAVTDTSWEYHWSPLQGGQERFAKSEIMHLRALSWKNWLGISPIMDAGRETIGLGMQQRAHAGKLFAQGAQVSGYLRTENRLSEEAIERLVKQFADKYAGVDNAWKTPVLEEGLDFVKLTMTGEESQLLESRRFEIAEICRIFGVPPHMVGDVDKATSWGTGIEQQSIGFLIFTLMPWFTNIASRVKISLLAVNEWQSYTAKHDTEPLTRGDFKSLQEGLQIQRQNGVINGDEWRARMGQNPTTDGTGADYWRPGNMLNVSRPELNPKPQPQQQRQTDATSAAALPFAPQTRFAGPRQP